jgi:hypothetical protein
MSPAILGGILLGAFLALCFWRILSRVGYTPWAAFLVFVPVVGQIILIVWLAFGRWPLLQYMEAWRRWSEHDWPGPGDDPA